MPCNLSLMAGSSFIKVYRTSNVSCWLFLFSFVAREFSNQRLKSNFKSTMTTSDFQLLATALAAFDLISSLLKITFIGLIWLAQIEFDRTLGYGLKNSSFNDTHFGRVGKN